MNRIYRIVWNQAQGAWVAATEIAKGRGPRAVLSARHLRRMGLASLAAGGTVALAAPPAPAAPVPTALPTGGQVVAGQAGITHSGATLTVQQSSQRAAIDWQRFDIGREATVRFAQPGRDSVTLNRVLDSQPSRLFGRIQADGQVFLSNPSGVYFAPGASADVGGLVATTMAIGVDDFMAGVSSFSRNGSTGAVVNEGSLQARYGGYIALLAPEVLNSGLVMAQAGTVALAAGEAVELQFAGGQLARLRVEPATVAALIENRQAVQAPDGTILMSARAAQSLGGSVIRHSGAMAADSLQSQGGRIVLEADRIELATGSRTSATGATGGGDIRIGGGWQGSGDTYQAREVLLAAGAGVDASATRSGNGGSVVLWSDVHNADSRTGVFGRIAALGGAQGGDGGRIETSGHAITISGSAVEASAPNGKGGEWLIDPYDMTISSSPAVANSGWTSTGPGSNMYVNDLVGQLNNGTSITVSTGTSGSEPGTITVNAAINKTIGGDATLTLKAADAIVVNSNIANSSASGKLNLVLWSDADGSGAGNIKLSHAGITTGGGHVWMGGGAGSSVFQGLAVGTAAAIGTRGIELGSGSSVVTGAGSISMTGTGTGSGSGAYGVLITGGSLVETSTGSITLLGRGSTTVGTGYNKEGVTLSGSSTVRITGGSGNLTVTGYGGNGGSGNYNIGVNATGSSVLEMGANATGAMNITGTGGTGVTGQWGVLVEGGSKYQSLGAATIRLTGYGGSGTGSEALRGNGPGNVIGHADMTGNITLQGDSLQLGTSGSSTSVRSSGQLQLTTTTPTLDISVGTAVANTLNVNGNHFNSIFSTRLGRVVVGDGARASTSSIIVNGPVSLSTANDLEINAGAGAISQNASSLLDAGSFQLVLASDRGVTQSTAGSTRITGSQVLLRGNGDFALSNAANAIGTLATDGGTGSLQLVNGSALTVGSVGGVNGIRRDGTISLRTTSGDLSVTQPIVTASNSDAALVLASGTHTAAGTSTGGDVRISGAGSLGTGATGRAVIYTGSIGGSTGVSDVVGSGTGRFRYGSNLSTTSYSAALGSTGLHAIYRERPVLDGSFDAQSNTYGSALPAFSATVAGGSLRHGDVAGDALAGAGTEVGKPSYSSSGQLNAGSYAIGLANPSADITALGYDLSGITPGMLTITPATLGAVTGVTAQDRVYDGSTVAGLHLSDARFQGAIQGDALLLVGATGQFADKNAGLGKTVNITRLALAGDDAANYVLGSTSATTTAGITPATVLAVNGITARDKVYDSSTAATLDTAGGQLVGLVPGDSVQVAGATGRFADKAAGSGKAVAISDVTLGGPDAGNYMLATNAAVAPAEADITPAALTLAGRITARSRVEDGSTAAQVDTSGLSLAGVASGDTVALRTGPARFDAAQQGNSRTVTLTGLAPTGADAANYRLANDSMTTTADLYAAPPLRTPTLPPMVVPTPPVTMPAGLPAPLSAVAAPAPQATAADSPAPADGAQAQVTVPAPQAPAAAAPATAAGADGTTATAGSTASTSPAPAPSRSPVGDNTAGMALAGSTGATNPAVPGSTTGAANGAAITVQLVQAPSAGGAGVVTVSVPRELLRSAGGFSFPLPDALQQPIRNGATVSVSTADGRPLPQWLRLEAGSGRFIGQQVPQGGLPLQVQLVLDGQRTVISIDQQGR